MIINIAKICKVQVLLPFRTVHASYFREKYVNKTRYERLKKVGLLERARQLWCHFRFKLKHRHPSASVFKSPELLAFICSYVVFSLLEVGILQSTHNISTLH